MKFTTQDKAEFYSMVQMCVTNGLTFEAITCDGIYEVTFTGGW